MPLVMLKGNWPGGVFHRSVRDAQGGIVKRLDFKAGEPVNLTGDDLLAVKDDIGHALVAVTVNGTTGKTTIVDATDLDIVAAAKASAEDEAEEEPGEPVPAAMPPDADAVESEPVASPEKTDGPKTGRQDRKRR